MQPLTLSHCRFSAGSRAGRALGPRFAITAAAIVALLAVLQTPAGAATSPYSGSGYDASYGQCGATTYPPGFAIIGLGGGRPFTTNSCLTQEWAGAASASASGTPSTPSLYFNTGYAGAYGKDITATCQNAAPHAPIPPGTSSHQASVERKAWEIGCSEADYAVAKAPGTPAMWWADVETGNSWSSSTTYNDFTIDGLSYAMSTLTGGVAGGFYSTPSMWTKIAGANFVSTPAITADWEPGGSTCPASGFSLQSSSSYSPVWLVQDGTFTVNGVSFSYDYAC